MAHSQKLLKENFAPFQSGQGLEGCVRELTFECILHKDGESAKILPPFRGFRFALAASNFL